MGHKNLSDAELEVQIKIMQDELGARRAPVQLFVPRGLLEKVLAVLEPKGLVPGKFVYLDQASLVSIIKAALENKS